MAAWLISYWWVRGDLLMAFIIIGLLGGTVYFILGVMYCRKISRLSDSSYGGVILLMLIQNSVFSGNPVSLKLDSPEAVSAYSKVEALVKMHFLFVVLWGGAWIIASRL